jgi:hypothetical protein
MENSSIYSEARNEYLKQLSTWIVPPLVEFFRNEYERISRSEGRTAMRAFQAFCAEVPRWNQDIIEKNINTILDNCRCDYVEELMTAVFVAHTKMLTAIRVSTRQKKLSITLPKLDHFLHRVFVECARSFWKAPFLFADDISMIERQKNVLQAETMCTEAVSGAVRSLLPVKNILRDYLDESDSEEEALPQPKKKKGVTPAAPPVAEAEDSDSSSSSDDEEVPGAAALAPKAAPFSATEVSEVIESEALETEEAAQASAPAHAPAPAAPVVLEKLPTPPEAPQPTASNHEVKEADIKKADVTLEKLDTSPDPPKLMIDTEPAVHFTPYDTVFDENTPGVSEIRYTEKVSVEDKPPSNWGLFDDDDEEEDAAPRLSFSATGSALELDDVEDLDQPFVSGVSAVTPEEDIDAPLGTTADFEELA